jgi:hypothetical protein
MKVIPRLPRTAAGSTLILTVVVIALIGFVLASYLGLVQSQNIATARSQAWNSSVPIIEAGIEDALTHLNVHAANDLACDGWTQAGSHYFIKRNLGDGYYVVTISNWFAGASNGNPVIESRGYVNVPLLAGASPNWMFADASPSLPAQNYLARGVRVTTGKQGLFTKAMVAKGQITLSGNAETDSFNSEDPAWSTNGLYDPNPAKTRDNGDVATNGQLIREINATGNVKIRGHVSTGPGGTVGFTGNTAIGSKTFVDGGNTGIEPGWFKDDMNVSFPDVGVPFTGGYFTPSAGTYNGTNYHYVIGEGNWRMSSLSMSSTKVMMVTGNAVLYVTGNVSLSGQAYIAIAPGASLKLYVGGSASLSGQGVANATGNARNFVLYGLPSCQNLSLSGNSAFIGIIYAPNADFTLSGGGSDEVDFIGASITKTVNMSGKYNFHYDESLATWGPAKGFTVTSWNEMTPQEAKTLPTQVAYLLNAN